MSGPAPRPGLEPARRDARLRVDPVACDGIGLCARIAPTLVSLDRWGFPILDEAPLATTPSAQTPLADARPGAAAARAAADRAVRACPRRALWVDDGR